MRRHLSARGLGLLALAVALIAVMVGLGLWQYGAYDEHQQSDAQALAGQQPVDLGQTLGPDDAFPGDSVGRPVEVSGSYVAADQIYVTDLVGAADHYAVVTPLLTDNGAAILVVRGSTEHLPADVPTGQILVRGLLQPSMDEGSALDADRVATGIRISSLIGDFNQDLYSGYVVLTSSQPAEDLTPVDPPLPDPSRWAGIRNLIYALQWWLFAAFVAFMWWRIAHEDDDETPADVG